MECPHRWTFVVIVLYSSFQGGLCQNIASGNVVVRDNRECAKSPGIPSSTELYNSILTTAATNGVLPDLIPMLQGQQIVDNHQRFPYPQDILTKPLSVVPMPAINAQEPIIFSSQPIRPSPLNQNLLVATPLPCGSSCPPNTIPAIPQTISPPILPPSNCVSQIAQALPLENYPVCAPNVGVVRPTPIVLQPQCPFNEVNPYNCYNQIAEPILLPEVNTKPINVPILPPAQILPPINTCSGPLEITPNLGPPCLSQPIVFTSEGQQMPFQINVPTSVPAPRVTVVSASPSNTPVPIPLPCCPEYPTISPPFQYPPQAPIILGGSSKSSWRNLLPIILVALFSDRGCNNDGGCCRCCCSCNGGSGNNIPIPYPIPIPINNPIVNTWPNPYSSRNREYRDDGDDDFEDWKRK